MAIPLDTNSRTDDIVDGISRLVLEGGFERVTIRAIAEQVRISPGTLVNHLSNRERILRVCAFRFADRRMRELDDQVRRVGAVGLMPVDDHDLRSARIWMGWREMARHAEGPAQAVAEADHKEEWLLRRALADGAPTDSAQAGDASAQAGDASAQAGDAVGRLLPELAIQICLATLRGLREAVCARGEHALDVTAARALWLAQLEATASARARSSATMASGSSAE